MADTVLNRTGPDGGGRSAAAGAGTVAPRGPGQRAGAGQGAQGDPPVASPASPRPLLRSTGIALLLLAALVLGFAGYLYGASGIQEARSQTVMFTQLRGELAGQLAPLGPATPGSPVAILDVPSIGIHDMVVVQGTSPQNLTLGPGHRRDTPLPGQAGVSQIYGRRATFGGPFARLGQLRAGAIIRVATGQGWSTYTVAGVADGHQAISDPVPNRLLLLTASSALVPSYHLTVDARLASAVHASPGVARVIDSPELPQATDTSALALTTVMEWGLALALVSAGATFAALRWSAWPAYLAAAPLVFAVLWNLYQSLAALLPNLY